MLPQIFSIAEMLDLFHTQIAVDSFIFTGTVRLNTCSLAWPVYRPGYESGPVCERSSEFRHVCYRINLLI